MRTSIDGAAPDVQKEQGSVVETGGASPMTEGGADARHQDNPGEGKPGERSKARIAFEKDGGKVQRRTERGADRCGVEDARGYTTGR
jgi:hypothetical protein